MFVFKCKMCGGTLEINNESIATCEYCGTQQTLPKLSDERRVNLYDRANHFRRNNEFDKAEGIYEQILNEDHTDAESYWSLVLCRYGIEYVEDPATHKRIPTVNRAQFTSIFDDDNYKSALQYADGAQRNLYEEEAKAINEIQKGILAISEKEEPFDIFICYKETDRNGRRTPDSVLAYDLYQNLTQEGFKVFFARITLEDKLGVAYEPYIFAALNSAKVMVVLGTRQEYFNAVWVKNEWSRYLVLIKNGAKKYLIPAYRDMDPYDLPDEFSHLQAQDMSKLGFMQDLIRGIKKLIAANVPKNEKEPFVVSGNANVAPLLKRAFMFLEDGDWDRADDFCEQVLNLSPECAEAYVGKLMVALRVGKKEELANCAQPFDEQNYYQKAIRYAAPELKKELLDYVAYIKERNEYDRKNGIYQDALRIIQTGSVTEEGYKSAVSLFVSISGFKDADALAADCEEKAIEAHNELAYQKACKLMESNDAAKLQKALREFESISDWKDVESKEDECKRKIEYINNAKEKRIKRTKRIVFTVSAALCAIIASVVLLNTVILPMVHYNKAAELYANGNFDDAITEYTALGDYKDSAGKVYEVMYAKAESAFQDKDYDAAVEIFSALGKYKDSVDQVQLVKFEKAGFLREQKKYKASAELYKSLGKFSYYHDVIYEYAESLLAKGDPDAARNEISKLAYIPEYYVKVDVFYTKLQEHYYSLGRYDKAKDIYQLTQAYEKDSEVYKDIYYKYAIQMMEEKQYLTALAAFGRIKGYLDVDQLILQTHYAYGEQLYKDGEYFAAVPRFEKAQGYKDSEEYIKLAKYFSAINDHDHYDREEIVYEYLKELKRINFKNSAQLFDEYYAWKAEIVVNNDRNDSETDMKSVSKFDDWCFHIKLSGGEPGATVKLKYTGYFPDGSTRSNTWDGEWSDGYSGTCGFYYNNPAYGKQGTFTFKLFDGNGKLIAEKTIKITS